MKWTSSLALSWRFDVADVLLDPFHGRRLRRDFHAGGMVHERRGEFLDRGRHGGREEERLALRRQLGDDALDFVDEAEVEHAVGFVEDEDFDLVEADVLLAFEVHAGGPAWR
jgi:hypothetical protein